MWFVLLSVLLASCAMAQTTETAAVATKPMMSNELSLVEFVSNRIKPHEPMYFIAGFAHPNAKFQLSIKYQMFNDEGTWVQAHPWMKGFYAAYTQTSLWTWGGDSSSFYDTSYRPEVFWQTENLRPGRWPGDAKVDFATGLEHESNGKGGDDSRTINHLYVEPIITFGDRQALFLTIAPKIYTYLGEFEDTPDVEKYRGYCDLKVIFGQGNGWQARFLGRLGSEFDKGSLQVDVSYPLRRILNNNLDLYLHMQVFTGYGESLLDFQDRTTQFRIGFSLVR
jgi:outer membrane phospholipase A